MLPEGTSSPNSVLLYDMCHTVCDPQLFHTDENSTPLFNFVAVVKAHLFGVQGMPKIFLRVVSNRALILSIFSQLVCFLSVLLLSETEYIVSLFSYKLFSCIELVHLGFFFNLRQH
jgi:hypothetical protein